MTLNGSAYIVGAYEHPTRKADDLSVARLHADVALGALADAGLSASDIDGYFCAGDAPGLGTTTIVEYLGLQPRHVDSTECGGSAPILHVAHAAAAIAAGRCNVALITLAGRPRAAGAALSLKAPDPDAPELAFELPFGPATQNLYGMVARRHMHEFGTTGEAPKHAMGGKIDLTWSAAAWSGPAAFAEAGVTPADIKYASLYDSFTITVLMQLEDLGFCKKGEGGKFVADGGLISGVGHLPFNTDGGGLCNNHPANRGGVTKVIEAVRQLRGEAHPRVQVKNCDLALAHGTGGSLGHRHGSSTIIMERE